MRQSSNLVAFVLVMHGGPVVLPRHPRESVAEGAGPAILEGAGLWAKRERLDARWKDEQQWGEGVELGGPVARLLEALVMEAKFHEDHGFFAPVTRLRRAVASKGPTVGGATFDGYAADLRTALGKRSMPAGEGIPPELKEPLLRYDRTHADKLSLNVRLVRCDWFEVVAAEMTARQQTDRYEKAHALAMAERAYVESCRLTPRDIVARARKDPPSRMKKIVTKRWELRYAYLKTLCEIGHFDTMVTEYRLWKMLAQDELADRVIGADGAPCHDEDFDLEVSLLDAKGNRVPALDALGSIEVRRGESLEDVASRRRPRPDPPPHTVLQGLKSKCKRKKKEAAARSRDAKGRAVEPTPRIDVEWRHVEALLKELLIRLDELVPGGFLPQVIIGLGRGGNLVAAALSDALPCRAVGSISIDRYNDDGSVGTGVPYLRGTDLPDKRGCRVLVCDDVITSGKTVKKALKEVVRPHYPAAHIVVVSLILNKRATQLAVDGDDWVGGIEVNVQKHEEFWLDFHWRNLRKPAQPYLKKRLDLDAPADSPS